MIRKSVFQAIVAVAFAGAALIVQAAEATKPAPAKTPWKIVGQLEEACSCNLPGFVKARGRCDRSGG